MDVWTNNNRCRQKYYNESFAGVTVLFFFLHGALVGAEQSERRMSFHSLKVLVKEVNTHSVRQGNKKNGRSQEKCQYMYRKD